MQWTTCRDRFKQKLAAAQPVLNQHVGFLEQLCWAVILFHQGRGEPSEDQVKLPQAPAYFRALPRSTAHVWLAGEEHDTEDRNS